MAEGRLREAGGPIVRAMTVARVFEPTGADHAEVTFLESARFYQLPKANPRYTVFLEMLRAGLVERRPFGIRLASLDSDVIESVEPEAG